MSFAGYCGKLVADVWDSFQGYSCYCSELMTGYYGELMTGVSDFSMGYCGELLAGV